MTEPIVPAEEDNSPTTSTEAPASQPVAPTEDSDFKKMYYREFGKRKELENDFTSFKSKTEKFMNEFQARNEEDETVKDLIASGYEEDEARKVAKAASLISKRKGSSQPSGGTSNLPYDPEREAFLQKHPEAYQFISEIDNLKGIAPSRKYEDIAISMRYITPQQEEPVKSFQTSGGSQPSPTPKV